MKVEQLANNFKNQANKSSSKGVECNHAEISKRFFFSIKKLTRIVPQYDSINVFYDGRLPSVKSVLPIAILSRFFGKEVNLFFYPSEDFNKFSRSQYKAISLFKNVVVGSRFMQRELKSRKVEAQVELPFVELSGIKRRVVSGVQPHILLIHNNAEDSGAVCAIRAFKFVKQKYPRTEMTIVTDKANDWQHSRELSGQNISGLNFIDAGDKATINEALEKSDTFINCSLSETIPQPLLVALSAGLPAVSFETYGPREIIEHGVNGFLIRHNDSSQLADRIIELVEEPGLVEKFSTNAVKIRPQLSINNIIRPLA